MAENFAAEKGGNNPTIFQGLGYVSARSVTPQDREYAARIGAPLEIRAQLVGERAWVAFDYEGRPIGFVATREGALGAVHAAGLQPVSVH